jgi:hypothetical protein
VLVQNSEILNELLVSNSSFRQNFEKLLLAFQDRMWTKDTRFLFRVLCEDLFRAYNIHVSVSDRTNLSGDGQFSIEILNTPETQETIAILKDLRERQKVWDGLPFWRKWFSKRPII